MEVSEIREPEDDVQGIEMDSFLEGCKIEHTFNGMLLSMLRTPVVPKRTSECRTQRMERMIKFYEGADVVSEKLFADELIGIQRYYNLTGDRKNTTKILRLLAVKVEVESVVELLSLTEEHEWIEFYFVLYGSIFDVLPTSVKETYPLATAVMKIKQALRTKDLLVGAIECFKIIYKYMELTAEGICHFMKVALQTGTKHTYLAYNLVTFLLPIVKSEFKIAEYQMIKRIFDDPTNLYEELVMVHIVRSLLAQRDSCHLYAELHTFVHTTYQAVLNEVYQALCVIKKSNYEYTSRDITFILSYIDQNVDQHHITNWFPYFVSHIHEYANKLAASKQCVEKWITIVDVLHEMSMRLLRCGNERVIDLGANIYLTIYNVLKYNKVTCVYNAKCSEYSIGKSPFYRALVQAQRFPFGKLPDVQLFVRIATVDTCLPLMNLLKRFPNTCYLIGSFTMFQTFYSMFVLSDQLYLESKIDQFMEMMIQTYYMNENIMLLFVRKLMESFHLQLHKLAQVDRKQYIWIRIVMFAVLSVDPELISADEALSDFKYMLSMFYGDDHEPYDKKTHEKLVTASVELVLLFAKNVSALDENAIKEILICGETIIKSNMRSASFRATLGYKSFITAKASKHINFFREYLKMQLSMINPDVVQLSNLRRAAEYRAILHSLCTGFPRKYREEIVTNTINTLLGFVTDENPTILSVTCHVLHELMQDHELKQYTRNHESHALIFSILMVGNRHFSVKNAAYFLFETIVNRMLPSSCRGRNRSLEEILIDYPVLQQIAFHIAENRPIDISSKIIILTLFNRSEQNCVPIFGKIIVTRILPICLALFEETHDKSTSYLINLFISIVPPHQIIACFFAIYHFIEDEDLIPLQLYSNCFYILTLLLETYRQFLMATSLSKYFEKWVALKNKFLELRSSKRTMKLQKMDIINIAEVHTSQKFSMHKLAIEMNHLDVQQSIAIYKMLISSSETSDFVMLAATDILLTRLTDEDILSAHISFITTATINLLLINNIKAAETLVIKMIHTLLTTKVAFSESDCVPLLALTNNELMKRLSSSSKYTSLYIKVIASVGYRLPKLVITCIIQHFYSENDDEVAATLPDLLMITNDKIVTLNVALYVLINTDCEKNVYILQKVQSFLLGKPINLTFSVLFDILLSKRFLYDYFTCPKLVLKFITVFAETVRAKDINCKSSIVEAQYSIVYKSFCMMLQSI